ncbi:GIY-YIG nuclease family protein [Candidatus Saccharibacteria bacterium]|nr:GIY-YIG nuclease family protein [Candidatus Saccharibacteria bacterium]
MFWVYILELSNGKHYIGQTNNLVSRLKRHQTGQSQYTRAYLPIRLRYSEIHRTRALAVQRERYLKSLKNKSMLNQIIASDGGPIV